MSTYCPPGVCPTYSTAGGNGTDCFRLYDKLQLTPDLCLIQTAVTEVINSLGQTVNYFINTYQTASADNIYGEQPTSIYVGPIQLQMYIQLNENALAMSRFGYVADDDVTGYLSISGFVVAMSGQTIYATLVEEIAPKADDLFQMVEYGNDRPGNRAGNYFRITERVDQDIAAINPLGGHTMWRIKGKRLEYSFEPGISGLGETGNNQVYDDTFSGILSSALSGQSMSAPKTYTETISADSLLIFDQNVNNTDVYGGYS